MGKDTIADILTLIRNADEIGKRTVEIPRTPDTERIVRILIGLGLVKNIRKLPKSRRDWYVFTLRIVRRKRERDCVFKPFKLKRITTPRIYCIYCNYQQIPRVLGGMEVVILSTSRGIMTDREARLERIGGEVLYSKILPSEFYEKESLRYILVNGVEKKQISNITLDTLVNVGRGFN